MFHSNQSVSYLDNYCPDFYHHRLVLWIFKHHINGITQCYSVVSPPFIWYTVFDIHFVECIRNSFFPISLWYSIVWIYLTLFIHSFLDEYLSCLWFLAILNKAAISILVPAYLWTFLLGKHLEVYGLAHMVGMCFYKKLPNGFKQFGCHFILSPTMYWELQLLLIFTNIWWCLVSFNFSYFYRWEAIWHCGFNLHRPDG